MIYIINMLLIFLYAWALKPDGKSKLNRKVFCILVVVQLTCISGLQYGVGRDYFAYLRIYNDIREMTWQDLYGYFYFKEPIFAIYAKIMALLFRDNSIPYFCGMAFICAFFLMKALYDRKEHIVWSLYLYLCMGFFYISMNQIRQMMALSIVLYSVKFMEERKICKYFIWILVAACIHNSALVMLPCYLLNNMELNNKKKSIRVFVLVCVTVFLLSNTMRDVLSRTQYGWMLEYQAGSQINMFINLIYRGALLVLSIIYINYVLEKNRKYEVLYWLSMVGIMFQIISVSATSVGRIVTYFYSVFVFLLPIVISCIPKKQNRLAIKGTIIIGMMCYHCFYLYINLGGMEYTSVLQ